MNCAVKIFHALYFYTFSTLLIAESQPKFVKGQVICYFLSSAHAMVFQ